MKKDENYLKSRATYILGYSPKYVKLEDALETCAEVRMEQGCIEEDARIDHGWKCYTKAIEDVLAKIESYTISEPREIAKEEVLQLVRELLV